MATVPVYQQSVSLRPKYQQGVDVRASDEAFGAAEGRGLVALGQGLDHFGKAYEAVKDKEDETRAKEADIRYADWMRKALYDPETGYMNKEGVNAVEAREGLEQDMRWARSEFGKDLSPKARELFDNAAIARQQSGLQTAIVHAGGERKKWFTETSNSRIKTFANDAVSGYTDDKTVMKNIALGARELSQQAEEQGWDADTLNAKQQGFVSGVRLNVALRMAESDPIAAKAYVDKHRDQMTADDQYKLDHGLKGAVVEEQSKREADRILGQGEGAAGESGGAAGIIKRFEGYRSTPYWDVNANRAGYGSDTVTRADGTVERVTASTVVTREDASRDLNRRIGEFQAGIVRDVGEERWAALPENAKAALTSVAYNYGSLPKRVVSAVSTGDTAQIAAAVEGLSGDNDGVNAKRRAEEAAIIRGGDMPAGPRSVTATSFTNIERELANIADPDVRDMTRKRINSAIEMQSKADEQRVKAAKAELWSAIDQGKTPDDVPFAVREAAGMDAVSSSWAFVEKRSKRQDTTTDETLFYQMRREAAENPSAFAQKDLNDYRDRIAPNDIRELASLQTSALADQRKARTEGIKYSEAYKMADDQLRAVGIDVAGKQGSEREGAAKRIAQFQNSMTSMLDEFKEKNGRPPEQAEIQSIINKLMLPVIIKKPGQFWGTNDTPGFAFEAPYRPDGSTVDVKMDFNSIPIDLRRSIAKDLELETGRKPTPEEVADRYEEFVLSR